MAQHLSELLGRLPVLQQAQTLAVLQRHLDSVLPVKFRGKVQVVGLEQGELRTLCENGAIASRLRLEPQHLAVQLQANGLRIRSISFKVRPAASRKTTQVRPKAPLSGAAQTAFSDAAKNMPEGEVKAALQKLLKHHAT